MAKLSFQDKARVGGFKLADDFDTLGKKMQKQMFKKARKDFRQTQKPISTRNITKRTGFNPFTSGGVEHAKLGWLDTDYNKVRDTMYDPTMGKYLDKATEGIDVQDRKARAAADVMHSFDGEEATLRRNMGRFGIDPTSQAYQQGMQKLSLARATGKAGAITAAAERADQEQFGRLSDAVGKVSPMMESYLSSRGQVGLGLRQSQMQTFTGMYDAEKKLAGDTVHAGAMKYGSDKQLEGTMAQIASNEKIASMNRGGGGGGGGSSYQYDPAYDNALAALEKEQNAALAAFDNQGPDNSSYWGTIVGAVTPTLVDQGIDWLFGK